MPDESGPPDFDAVRYWLRIPRPRYSIRIEPDHQHARYEDWYVHRPRLPGGVRL
jgi:hypothetical protein